MIEFEIAALPEYVVDPSNFRQVGALSIVRGDGTAVKDYKVGPNVDGLPPPPESYDPVALVILTRQMPEKTVNKIIFRYAVRFLQCGSEWRF